MLNEKTVLEINAKKKIIEEMSMNIQGRDYLVKGMLTVYPGYIYLSNKYYLEIHYVTRDKTRCSHYSDIRIYFDNERERDNVQTSIIKKKNEISKMEKEIASVYQGWY